MLCALLFSLANRKMLQNKKTQMKNKLRLFIIGSSLLSVSVLIGGCGSSETEGGTDNEIEKIDTLIQDTSTKDGDVFMIGGQIFSIPSPVQTAFLIKDLKVPFNSEYTNPSENAPNYSTSFQKAINLGVYGADLGYLTIYEQTDGSLKYLKSVRQISKDLGLEGAFDEKLAERFSDNMGNQDSMLVFVSDAYKNSDNYLKNNDKDDVAALVLVGGWLESMYIAVAAIEVVDEDNKGQLIERLGDQKNALSSLISMLNQYSSNSDYDDLIVELEDLYSIFESVKYTYEYWPSATDEANKITVIKSKHTVDMTDGDLEAIIEKIESIRNEIVE